MSGRSQNTEVRSQTAGGRTPWTTDLSTSPGRVQIVDREPIEVVAQIAFALDYLLNAERRRHARHLAQAGAMLAGLAAWAVVFAIGGAS